MLTIQNLDTEEIIGEKYILLKKKFQALELFLKFMKEIMNRNRIKVPQILPSETNDQLFEKLRIIYKREIRIHQRINNKNVLKMIQDVNYNQNIYLILELCEEGNLNRLLNRNKKRQLDQEQAFQIFSQIVNGYNSFYESKTLHRDLKPENILFTKGIVKIADLGVAKIVEEMGLAIDHTIVGTLLYQAPVMMACTKYSDKVDLWSLGIIFYEMLYGVLPYVQNHPKKLYKLITTEPLIFPQDVQINQSYIELIKKLLQVDPETRITWQDLRDCLSKNSKLEIFHYKIQNGNFQKYQNKLDNDKNGQEKIKSIEEIKHNFDHKMRLISFSFNNATKLFFHCYHNLNQARFFYILFSVTSTKYLLNELNFYQQIIQGKIPPSNKNLKENDIKTVQNSEHQYYDVFNSFQANYEQINKFYTEKLLNQFDKLKSIYSEKYKQLIQIVNEIVKTDKTDEITQNNFNIKFISNAQDEFLNQSKNDKILMMQHQDKFIHYKYICFIHFIPRSLNKMNQKIQKKKQINLQLRNYKIKFSIQE